MSVAAASGENVLRVVVEGISEEEARRAKITLVVRDEGGLRVPRIEGSWMCQGSSGEFNLDSLFARVTKRGLHVGTLLVYVDHPLHPLEQVRISRSDGVEGESGQTVYEARVTLTGTVFWPELTLTVRDAHTRAHLQNVELHGIATDYMGQHRQPGPGLPYTAFGRGLSSPISLMGGHKAGEPEHVAAVALRVAAGEAPQVVDLKGRSETARGVIVYARAPGYGWGRMLVDFSTGGTREFLLERGAELGVRLENVQLERYAALGTEATLFVRQPGWGVGHVWVQRVDEALATEGLWLEGIEPGELTVTVELGKEWSRRKRPVLAYEEFTLAAGERAELVLTLSDPPAPPERVSLGGVVSFPAFGAEADLVLQLYQGDFGGGGADFELTLAEMEPVHVSPPEGSRDDDTLRSWLFQLEGVPVGTCQIQLLPFHKSWMVDVPPGGREDLALVISELAEVFVETVDVRTRERVPTEKLRYIYLEDVPGRVHSPWSDRVWTDFESEPGLFRFWTAPGPVRLDTWELPDELGYAFAWREFELVPGLQSLHLELAPPLAFKIEFRVDGAALPYDDRIYWDLQRGIRAVGHQGRASHVSKKIAWVSLPGVYEVRFEGVGADRFLPIAPHSVEVLEGETVELIVELRRK